MKSSVHVISSRLRESLLRTAQSRLLQIVGSVVGISIVLLAVAAATSSDEPGTISEAQLATVSPMKSLPPVSVERLNAAHQAYTQVLMELVTVVDKDLKQIADSANSGAFAEVALSWQAVGKLLDSNDNRWLWLSQQYDELMFSPEDMEALLKSRIEGAYHQLRDVSLSLVDAEATAAPEWPPIEVQPFELGYARMLRGTTVQAAMEAGDFAPIETAGNFIVSALVGAATESVVRGMGNETDGNENLAAVAGFGAGLASDMITTDLIGSKNSLQQETQRLFGLTLDCQAEGEDRSRWVAEVNRFVQTEWIALCTCLANKYGIPVEDVYSTIRQ